MTTMHYSATALNAVEVWALESNYDEDSAIFKAAFKHVLAGKPYSFNRAVELINDFEESVEHAHLQTIIAFGQEADRKEAEAKSARDRYTMAVARNARDINPG